MDFSVATALWFNVERVAYDTSLSIKNLTCAEEGSDLPGGLKKTAQPQRFAEVSVYGRMISAAGLRNGERYTLSKVNGQIVSTGIVRNAGLSLVAGTSGRYVLKVGAAVYPLSIR